MSELDAGMNGGGMSGAQVQTGSFSVAGSGTYPIILNFSADLFILINETWNQINSSAFYIDGRASTASVPKIYIKPGKSINISYQTQSNSSTINVKWIAIKF